MDADTIVTKSTALAAKDVRTAPSSPSRPAKLFCSPSSAVTTPTRLNIMESTKNDITPPSYSLRSPMFSSMGTLGSQNRAQFSSPSNESGSSKLAQSSTLKDSLQSIESSVDQKKVSQRQEEPRQRQAKIMTKAEKLQLKGARTDDDSPLSAEMTIGLAPTSAIRLMRPDKKRKMGESGDGSVFTLFGERPTFATSSSASTTRIDDIEEVLEPKTDATADAVQFEDDILGLIARHKSAIANRAPPRVNDVKKEKDASESPEDSAEEAKDLVLSENGKLPVVRVPATLSAKLFDYQREGIRFLYNLYISNRGGILADDMGLGKTIQTICFVLAIKAGQAANLSFFNHAYSSHSSSSSTSSVNGEDSLDKEAIGKLFAPVAPLPVLIIAPASLLQHWHREFYQWTKLRTFIAHGKQERTQVMEIAKNNKLDVVLMSYDTLLNCEKELKNVDWSCAIFDEAHKVKSRTSKQFRAVAALRTRRKFGLTGTVMQNSFEELWSLCHALGFASSALGDLEYFKKNFVAPIKEGHVQDASSAQVSRAAIASSSLVDKLSKFILRRTKQCIAHQLPPKEDHVVFCAPTNLQLRIYKRITESPLYKILRQNSTPCTCGSGHAAIKCCSKRSKLFGNAFPSTDFQKVALPALTRLQQLANHVALIVTPEIIQELQALALLKKRIGSPVGASHGESAPTGVDTSTKSHLITNFFQSGAGKKESEETTTADKKLQKSKGSPPSSTKMLRPSFAISVSTESSTTNSGSNHGNKSASGANSEQTLSSKISTPFLQMAFGEDIDAIAEALATGDEEMELCGKLKVLASLLPHWKEQGSKVLLFSSSTRLMDILAKFCTKQGFSFGRVEGSTPIHQRQRLVDQFNKTKSQFVFIVSTKACGVGLNLSSANVVVIFEPHFNVSLDMQASDRAHRIGQVRTTRVYRLVSAFTVEELTYRRQIYKQQMAHIATEGRSEKRFFKMTEVFGAHLLFSLLDRSQLNTVDILERENTLGTSTRDGTDTEAGTAKSEDGRFRVTRDGVSEALAADSKSSNPLLQLVLHKAQATDDLGLGDDDGDFNAAAAEATDDSVANDGEKPNLLDQSDFNDMDEILKKAGALHSHLNSELFSPTVANPTTNGANASTSVASHSLDSSPPIADRSSWTRPPRTSNTFFPSQYERILPIAPLGSIRANQLSEEMEHLSPAFIGDAATRRNPDEEEFPEL